MRGREISHGMNCLCSIQVGQCWIKHEYLAQRFKKISISPRVSSDANDGDGCASDPNKNIEIINNDAQEAKKLRGGGAAGLLDTVAALNGASAALACRSGATSGCGNRKGSKSESGKNGGFELHIGRGVVFIERRL